MCTWFSSQVLQPSLKFQTWSYVLVSSVGSYILTYTTNECQGHFGHILRLFRCLVEPTCMLHAHIHNHTVYVNVYVDYAPAAARCPTPKHNNRFYQYVLSVLNYRFCCATRYSLDFVLKIGTINKRSKHERNILSYGSKFFTMLNTEKL